MKLNPTQPPSRSQRLSIAPLPITLLMAFLMAIFPFQQMAHAQGSGVAAELGKPFTLKVGQTGAIASENFKLTLRSASDDSGCFAPDDCSSMNFDGTIALQHGDEKNLLTLMAGWSGDEPSKVTDFDGYVVLIHRVEKVDGALQATFSVERIAVVRATTEPAIACVNFSKADAEAILGEAAQAEPIANLLIDAAHEDSVIASMEAKGLCGYGSIAPQKDAAPEGGPRIVSDIASAHAVVAEKSNRPAELLSVLHAIQADDKDADPTAAQILVTMLSAGDSDSVIPRLQDAADGLPNTRAVPLPNLGKGKGGLWIWQTWPSSRYAALVVQTDRGFIILQAVLGPKANADAVQTAALRIARKLDPALGKSAPPQATSTPIPPKATCMTLTASEARAILGEPVQAQPSASIVFEPRNFTSDLDQLPTRGLCGYGSVAFTKGAKPSSNTPRIASELNADHAAVGELLMGRNRIKLLDVIALIDSANPGQDDLRFKAQSNIVAGQWDGLLSTMAAMAKDSKIMKAQFTENKRGEQLWLWRVFNGGRMATLLRHQNNDSVIIVQALLGANANEDKTLSAMLPVADHIAAIIVELPPPTETPFVKPTARLPRTPIATRVPSALCKLLTRADAADILKETIAEKVESDGQSCGYQSTAKEPSRVMLVELGYADAIAAWVGTADELIKNNPTITVAAATKIKAQIKADADKGNAVGVFNNLIALADGVKNFNVQPVTIPGANALWIMQTDEGRRIGGLMLSKGEHLYILAAMPNADRIEKDLLAALVKVAAKIK